MNAAMILVLILTAGVVALLAWFEINSRRNDANMQSKSTLSPSSFESPNTRSKADDKSHIDRKKAA